MAGALITFPLRLGWRAGRAAVRSGVQASERVIAVASFVVKSATSSDSGEDTAASDARPPTPPQPSPPAPDRPGPPATLRPGPPAAEPSAAAETRPPRPTDAPDTAPRARVTSDRGNRQPLPQAEPDHVSEEPTLVEAFAEPGAEDGAGAQVTIAEPWEGYGHMNAKDVIARVSEANAVELAAVQLYEAAHRSRETIMTAAERELRTKSGRGAATANQTRKEQTNGG